MIERGRQEAVLLRRGGEEWAGTEGDRAPAPVDADGQPLREGKAGVERDRLTADLQPGVRGRAQGRVLCSGDSA